MERTFSLWRLVTENCEEDSTNDIYRMGIETGFVERLTMGNGYATSLKVSADGKTAVFLKWRSDWRGTPNKSELYLLDMQSHKPTPFRVSGLN
jgi:hypothetical protein